MRSDAEKIYTGAINACLPDAAVKEALSNFKAPAGKLVLVAIGKAAHRMALAAEKVLTERKIKLDSGIVITKYGHSTGDIAGVEIYEAGHPLPDESGIRATERALELTSNLSENDCVLFLISGGGSALFESPKCTLPELVSLTEALLSSGADIGEINTVRKHISKVKGGRFARHVYPAKVFAIALSDVIGDRLDTIASGPCAPDRSTADETRAILEKYGITLSKELLSALMEETPKEIANATHYIGGSVRTLARKAFEIATSLGYETEIITDSEEGIARDVGASLARLAIKKCDTDHPLCYIIGGETVVMVEGDGLGGRNQEICLAASGIIANYNNIAIFSVGSDGTDGPTDAAGAFVDGKSYINMVKAGLNPLRMLDNNDAYHALDAVGSLIKLGATGTNVNDITVALITPPVDEEPDPTRKFANLERLINSKRK